MTYVPRPAAIHHRTGKIHRGDQHADCNSALTAIRVHRVPAGEIAYAPLSKFCKRCFPGQMTDARRTEIANELR